jgi:hypothetical protein
MTLSPRHRRAFISADPYLARNSEQPDSKRADWPCSWIACSSSSTAPPFVAAYKCEFSLDKAEEIRVHVSADERYELWLDGERVGRGSERGDADHWFFETYDLGLEAGNHIMVARVWSMGGEAASGAPYAQMSVYPGFILSPDEARWAAVLGTGVAAWQAKILGGYEFSHPIAAWGTGANLVVHGEEFSWGFERGAGEGWEAAQVLHAGCGPEQRNDFEPLHLMVPATLPPMLDRPWRSGTVRHVADVPGEYTGERMTWNIETITTPIPIRAADHQPEQVLAWGRLLAGDGAVTVPPRTRRRVIIDLEDYVCAYPQLTISGGAGGRVRIHWQESLYEDAVKTVKGNRDEIEGKIFTTVWWQRDGIGDIFRTDGGQNRKFDTLWWQCGRYIEIFVETLDEALTIDELLLCETRYPLEAASAWESSDARLEEIAPIMLRTLQECAHETYMDCPYFEQLMYIGDTRLQVLATYALSPDDRLPRKALAAFDWSRVGSRGHGLTQSRYPSRVRQVTRPFSLWWVSMLHDFALWRDDATFLNEHMPGARAVLDSYAAFTNVDGLIQLPPGPNFNFMDWVPTWGQSSPPDTDAAHQGENALFAWQWILVLRQAAQLEEWAGAPEMAARWTRLADECARAACWHFWDEDRGLFADDRAHTIYSEHTQCLAILADEIQTTLSPDQRSRITSGLLSEPDLARATIYFSHYLFETLRTAGRMDAFFERMGVWFDLKARGLKTTVEMPEPTRSDCHAWGAHPLFHFRASLLGIRPGAPGFKQVLVAPQLGTLSWARGSVPHPQGEVAVHARVENNSLRCEVSLPPGISGTLKWNGREQALQPGTQKVEF